MEPTKYSRETVLIAQWLMVAKNDYMVQIFLAGLSEGFVGTATEFSDSVTAAMDFANEQQREWLRWAYRYVTNKNLQK